MTSDVLRSRLSFKLDRSILKLDYGVQTGKRVVYACYTIPGSPISMSLLRTSKFLRSGSRSSVFAAATTTAAAVDAVLLGVLVLASVVIVASATSSTTLVTYDAESRCPKSCDMYPEKPVCGSDAKVYGNLCLMWKAACERYVRLVTIPMRRCDSALTIPPLNDPVV